ncbi:MAG: ATP-binding protein [Leptospirales bacterium]|nr:ATP-binding protein [Leptospirales bacterium]
MLPHLDKMLRLIRGPEFRPNCMDCLDLGVLYVPGFSRQDRGGYLLCKCQERISRCSGQPPYEYYDVEQSAFRPCPSKAARLRLEKLRILERKSGIPERYRGKFLDDIDGQRSAAVAEAVEDAVDTVVQYGQERSVHSGLYLHGPTGCGKTLISSAILNEVMRIYLVGVRYAKISRDIVGKLRATFNPNSEIYGEGRKIELELARAPALVIDDFGIQKETEWVNQTLYDLIDARYEDNLLTIVTSNEPMDSLRDLAGGRVYSRLREMCIEVRIQASDYRLDQA